MKLAVCTTASSEAVDSNGLAAQKPSFDDCRDLLQRQSPAIATRLGRLARAAERAITRGADDRFARARKLEEAVGYVAWLRPSHPESQALQRCVARLLRESFDFDRLARGPDRGPAPRDRPRLSLAGSPLADDKR